MYIGTYVGIVSHKSIRPCYVFDILWIKLHISKKKENNSKSTFGTYLLVYFIVMDLLFENKIKNIYIYIYTK